MVFQFQTHEYSMTSHKEEKKLKGRRVQDNETVVTNVAH